MSAEPPAGGHVRVRRKEGPIMKLSPLKLVGYVKARPPEKKGTLLLHGNKRGVAGW